MSQTTKRLCLSAIIAMVLGMLCPQKTVAQVKQVGRFISEVCVATHEHSENARQLLEDAGYEVLLNKDGEPGDFNKGAGGKFVFVGIKRTDDFNQAIVKLQFYGRDRPERCYGSKYEKDFKKAFPGEWKPIPYLGDSDNFLDGADVEEWRRTLFYKKNSPLSNSQPLETLKYANYDQLDKDHCVHMFEYTTYGDIDGQVVIFQEYPIADLNWRHGGDYVYLLEYYHEHKTDQKIYEKDGNLFFGHEGCFDGEGCNYYTFKGKGTEANPLEIETIEQWQCIMDCIKEFPDMQGYHYKLMNDFDYGGNPGFIFTDIFRGTFDGNGHTIRNFTLENDYCGLFQRAEGSTFKNLTLENFKVNKDIAHGTRSGGVCCYAKNCTFDNIKVINGDIKGSEGAGSIVFEMDGGVMTNCHATGQLYLNDGRDIGGLVGAVLNTASVPTRIEDCWADCTVKGDLTEHDNIHVGGLFGMVIGNASSRITINNCHNYSHVLAVYQDVGGIAAKASYVDVTNSWNGGRIEGYAGVKGTKSYGGGLFGTLDHSTIARCYNAGEVVFREKNSGIINGSLVGKSTDNTISNSYNAGYCDGYALIAEYSNTTCSDVYGANDKCLAEEKYKQVPAGCSLLYDAVDFASGKIAYLLNGNRSDGELTWYQLLGGDNSPVLTPVLDEEDNTINIVYQTSGVGCSGQAVDVIFTNDEAYVGHNMELVPMASDIKSCCNPVNFDYYHCTACDKYFYDILGEEEIENIILPKSHRLQKYDMVYDCVKGGMLDHYYCEDCHNSYSSNAEPETDKYFICHNHYEATGKTVVPIEVVETTRNSETSCYFNSDVIVDGTTFVGGTEVIARTLATSGSDVYTFTWPDTKYVSFKYYFKREPNGYDRSNIVFTIDNKEFLEIVNGSKPLGAITAIENSASGSLILSGHQPGDKVSIKMTVNDKNCRRNEKPLYFYFSLSERYEHQMRQYGGTYAVGSINTCLNNYSDEAHWHCMNCNGNFSDEAGEHRIGVSKPHNFTGHHEGGYFFKGQSTTLANGEELSFADLAEDHHVYIPEYWYCADCHQNFASSNPNSDEARMNFVVRNAQHNLVSEPIDAKLSLVQCECGYGKHYEYDADKAVITATSYDEENEALTFGDVDFTIGADAKVMDFSPRYSYKAARATLTESWIAGRSWGTKFVPFSFNTSDVPALQFYIIKEINLDSATEGDAVIVLEEVTGQIAAGTSLFVKAVDTSIASTTISATDADICPTGINNVYVSEDSPIYPYAMIGVTKARTVTKSSKTEGYYMAQDKLWHATGSFNVNPYRAYLNYYYQPEEASQQSARAFILITEVSTGIKTVEAVCTDGEMMDVEAVYDLSGKKLNKLQKGVNVVKMKDGSVKKVTMK